MAGEYRLLRKLGEGGFGAVYEAEHPLLKRRAAVKVLHRVADRDSDAVLRFISEAQAVNQIRNRHIVDVFSFGQLMDGRHFYVMDLLDGVPLDRFLKEHGRVEPALAIALVTPIAEALDLAHAAGIVHRDLKPQNIFLAWDPSGETVPKLLDFGMAKLLGESSVHTVSGTPMGTPLYMSPEQARGDKVDRRSDVYALGVLCHELLTGQLPFVADTAVAVLMAHIIQPAPRASEVCPELSPLFDAALLQMLDKDPNARPSTAGEAIRALSRSAEEAGIKLVPGPLRLPKPAVLPARAAADERDALLDGLAAAHSGAARTTVQPRPLWPFGVALAVMGAVLAFLVLHNPGGRGEAASSPLAPSGTNGEARGAPPSPLASASSQPQAVTSALVPSAAASSSAPPKRATEPPADTKPKARGPGATKIPTDLENPF